MRSIEDTFQGISEVFSNIQKEDGTPAGVDLDAVLSYLSELPVEGGSGGGSVTIAGDDVGLARKNQFDTKYTYLYPKMYVSLKYENEVVSSQ